jgi:hypothetical protein
MNCPSGRSTFGPHEVSSVRDPEEIQQEIRYPEEVQCVNCYNQV